MRLKTLFLLVAASSTGFSQDFLDPVIVTATRIGQPENQVPYSTFRIDSEAIRQETRRSLPEVLQYTPGVLVQKTAHGHGSPFIRGFTGRENLLLVDGVRFNNSTLRSGPVQYWNTVDSFSIDHLELVKSQGSVLYGPDAIGGTLNVFTKSSDFRSRSAGESYTGGSAAYEFRSNGQGSHIGRLETEAGVGGSFGVWLGLSTKDFGDIEDSSVGRMTGTGYPEQDFDFRADWAVTADSTLTLASNYVNQDAISRWHRTLANPGWEHDGHIAAPGLWNANTYDQERSMTYLRYAGGNPRAGAWIRKWNATISFQRSDDSEFQDRNPASNSIRESHIDLNTYGADLTLESDAGPGTLVYGIDYYHDDVDSSGYQRKADGSGSKELLPLADDSRYDLLGAFTQYVWKPLEPLEITAGARYTRAEASLGRFYDSAGAVVRNQSEDWDSWVGSLRGLYRIDSCWSLFGGLSQAFRAPNLVDLTGNLSSRSGNELLGSTGIDPEEFLTYEIGAKRATGTTSLAASLYYTDMRDLITGVPIAPGSKTTINANASEGYVYGIDLEGVWRFAPQWELSGFVAWQDARSESPDSLGGPSSDKPMSRQLPLTGSVALRWTDASGKFRVEGRLLAADAEDRITAVDQAADNQRIPSDGTPGYLVASLRAAWRVNEHLDLTCAIENLGDEDYRLHGSGQNESGMNLIFGAKVMW